MPRHVLLGCAAATAMWCALATAQADEGPADQIRAAMDTFLQAVSDQDMEVATGLLHERFVGWLDREPGVLDGAAIVSQITADPPPEGTSLGDCEPEVLGDVALAVAPLNLPADQGLGGVRVATVWLRGGDDWKLLMLTLGLDPEQATAMLPAFSGEVRSLDAFIEQIESAGAVGTAPQELVDLCLPEAVLGGPYGPGGALEVTDLETARPFVLAMPDTKFVPAEDPKELKLIGDGCAFWAVHTDVTQGEGEPTAQRQVMLLVRDALTDSWKIALYLGVPLK